MSPRRLLTIAFGLALSAGLLWWAFRGIRLEDVLRHVRDAGAGPVALTLGLSLLIFPIRMLRWRLMLRGPGGRPPDLRAAWHGITIGYMANTLLPLRAGEVLRCYVIARLGRVSVPAALASVAVERIVDALTVVALLAIAVLGGVPQGLEFGGLEVAALVRKVALLGLAALAGLGIGFLRLPALTAWLERAAPRSRIADRAAGLLHGIWNDLAVFRSPAAFLVFLALSVLVWLVNAAGLYALFPAFGIDLDFTTALVLQAVLVFGIALPSSPGFVGVYEAAVVFALGLYGVNHDRALAYALLSHVLALLPVTLLGMISVARTSVGWRDLRAAPSVSTS